MSSGLWLPSTSLTQAKRELFFCLVAVPDETHFSATPHRFFVERRDVEVLHTKSDRIPVPGTLSSGDRVVTSGIHRISTGQTVQNSDAASVVSL
ncbi:MAG: hypothetical protein GY758_04430 [Fuerstiella sp.]|nr:hypothetical protein [Fuerstiella sp.]MCP4510192.1 hypothetical protein [Fuerstiella sp.]